jgi:hypothetical protein
VMSSMPGVLGTLSPLAPARPSSLDTLPGDPRGSRPWEVVVEADVAAPDRFVEWSSGACGRSVSMVLLEVLDVPS